MVTFVKGYALWSLGEEFGGGKKISLLVGNPGVGRSFSLDSTGAIVYGYGG